MSVLIKKYILAALILATVVVAGAHLKKSLVAENNLEESSEESLVLPSTRKKSLHENNSAKRFIASISKNKKEKTKWQLENEKTRDLDFESNHSSAENVREDYDTPKDDAPIISNNDNVQDSSEYFESIDSFNEASPAKVTREVASDNQSGFAGTGSNVTTSTNAAAEEKKTVQSNTGSSSGGSSGASSVAATMITGKVYPLMNQQIVNDKSYKDYIVNSAYAATCSAAVSIYEINSVTLELSSTPLVSSALKSDASFSINATTANLNLERPTKYLIKVSGCGGDYSRIITSFKTEQDVSVGTTLFSKVLEVPTTKKMLDADSTYLEEIASKIDPSANTLEDAYSGMLFNTELASKFKKAFDSDITILTETKPIIQNENISYLLDEKTNVPFSITTNHWYSQYTTVQEWYLDDQFSMAGHNFIYSPTANDQGLHKVKIILGRDNGHGRVNLTQPYETRTWNINVANTFPALAPVLSLAVSNPSPVIANSFTASIHTGVNFSECENFSSMALTESSMLPTASEFNLSCTTQGDQSVSVVLSNLQDGAKNLYLWTKDSSGLISNSPYILNYRKDTANPTSTLNDIVGVLQGSSSVQLNFTGADTNEVNKLVLSYSLDDGANYTDITDLAAGTTTYSWSVPVVDSTDARVRLRVIDGAGKITDRTTSKFAIQVAVPAAPLYTLNTPATTNSLTARVTITSCSDSSHILLNSGSTPTLGEAGWVSCSTAASHYAYTLSSTEGAQTFAIWAKNSLGRVSASSTVNVVYDITPPAAPMVTLSTQAITKNVAAKFSASNCTDRPYLLLNSGSAPTAGDAGWVSCSITADAFSYNIPATEGSHSVSVWSKDVAGNVSLSATVINIIYDITPPTGTINNIASPLKGGVSENLVFTSADSNGVSSVALDYAQNGTTFTSIAANATSPYTWSVPSDNTASAVIRMTITDTAGNTATRNTSAFTIDSSAPGAPVVALYSPAISSSATVRVTVASCLDRPSVFVSESMTAPAAGDSGWVSCTTSAGGISYVLVGPVAQGVKSIYVFAKDAVGNVSTFSDLSMSYDTVNPTTNLATVFSGSYKGGEVISLSFSATDASGLNDLRLEYAEDGSTYITVASFDVTDTSYSWTLPAHNTSTARARIRAADNALSANNGFATSAQFTIDSTPPAAPVATLHSSAISNSASVTLTVSSCSDRAFILVNEGGRPSAGDTAWATCTTATGATSFSVSSTQGTHNLSIWAKDAVGNVSLTAGSASMILDTVDPVIDISMTNFVQSGTTAKVNFAITEKNASSAQTILVEYYNGTSWSTSNIAAANGPLNSQNFSTNVVAPAPENILLTYRVTYTDLAGNTKQSTAQFRTDSHPPVINSISLNGGSLSSTVNNIQVALSASDNLSNVTQFCLKYNNTSAPAANASCWVDVNAPSPGIVPAQSISFSGFSFQVGFTKASYSIYAWAKDETGQISVNAAAVNVDTASIYFDPGTPPVVKLATATSSDSPGNPLAISDLTTASGTDVYIKWHASDAEGLASQPMSIQYSTDDVNFIDLPGGKNLNNTQNGSCTIDANFTGCIKLSSPTSGYYKLRIIAKDLLGTTVYYTTIPLNENKLKILAGNTEHGLDGSARSAIFYTYLKYQDPYYTSKARLAVSDDGKIFYLDPIRGLLWIDPATGVLKVFIPNTHSATGDGGPVQSATLYFANAITIDHFNNLLIWDNNQIRKVNLDTMIITHMIGGGANGAPTATLDEFDLQVPAGFNPPYATMIPLPNGDLIFSYTGSSSHYRYRAADKKVEVIKIEGVGTGGGLSGEPWNTASMYPLDLAVAYNSTTSQIQFMIQNQYKNFPGDAFPLPSTVDFTSGNENTPYQANGPHDVPGAYRTYDVGLDGKIYMHPRFRSALYRYDHVNNLAVNILGTGTEGSTPCAENTPATSCNVAIDSVFISKAGRVYFIDNGLLRTIDDSHNVITLFGQYASYGNNISANAARFGSIVDISLGKRLPDNNKIIIEDGMADLFREITFDGNVTNLTPACYNWSGPWSFDADPATGDILSPCATVIRRFDRVSGVWSDVVGGGATKYYSSSAVGLPGAQIDLEAFYNVQTMGLIGSKLIYQKYSWNGSATVGCTIRSYDINDSYRLGAFMSDNGVCSEGVQLGNTMSNQPVGGQDISKFRYFSDPADGVNKFFFMERSKKQIFKSHNFGVIEAFMTLDHDTKSFTQAYQADGLNVYYCSLDGSLYKHNYNSGLTYHLTWSSPTTTCLSTNQIIYHPDRNSLIFVIRQNGLNGVAEYNLN